MEDLSYDPSSDASIYDQLTEQCEKGAQMALAMLNSTISGTARLRADASFLCGKPKSYRPDWRHEYEVVRQKLLAVGIDPEKGLTEDRRAEYREEWSGRFELVHEGDHFGLILEDPAMDIPDRARP